jgi:hypothetical protein
MTIMASILIIREEPLDVKENMKQVNAVKAGLKTGTAQTSIVQTQIGKLDIAQERKIIILHDALGIKEQKPEENWKAVYNVSKGKVASIVNKGYNVVQHKDVVQGFLGACDSLGLKTDVRIRDFGNRIWVDVNFPTQKIDLKVVGEEFTAGFRLLNSYDKTAGVMVIPMLKRLVCLNGMVMNVKGFVGSFIYKHNSSKVKELQSHIESSLHLVISSDEKLKTIVSECIADTMEWKLADRMMNHLLRIYGQDHIDAILEYAKSQLKPGKKITRWDLYNAMTWYISHGKNLAQCVEQYLTAKSQKMLNTKLDYLLAQVPEIENKQR